MSKVYFVTGANRGIGLELTSQLLKAGNQVIATARKPETAKELQGLYRDHNKTLKLLPLELTNVQSTEALESALQSESHIDVLINCAGLLLGHAYGAAKLDWVELQQSFVVNCLGPAFVTKSLLPWLLKASEPVVANITSLMGSIEDNSSGGAYPYRMSKAALNMYTKNLSLEYKSITTVCLHPGWVQTDMGGPNALITPQESARGLIEVISRLRSNDSGRFFDFRGKDLPW